jgi:murein DD-endopeptidase MepM/ murein hydrolase activator NlpD
MRSVTWRRLWWLGWLGLLPLAVPGTGALRVLLLFFLAPLVGDVVSWLRRKPMASADAARGPALPLPRPAQRHGKAGLLLRYHLSSLLVLLNPFQLLQLARQLRGERSARGRIPDGGTPSAGTYRQRVGYRLPFAGEWLVVNGGTAPENSHSWELISQRYAYDFVIADPAGERHSRDGTRKQDYFCYGAPMLAAADGVVIRVRDGVRDAPRVGSGWVDWRCRDFGGNSVTIQHAADEYSYAAHLIPGSIQVSVGERVKQGQQIGSCGHSGHSTEPHLHFQVQDHADFFRAVGLPVRFTGCCIDGEPIPEPVYLEAGMRVRPQPGGAPGARRAAPTEEGRGPRR